MYKYIKLSLLTFLFLFSFSCSDFLEVENMNDPDTQGVLSSPEGIKALTGSLFNTWFTAEQNNVYSPGPALWVMADWGTVTFANYGCVDMSKEPREFLNNNPSYGYHSVYRVWYSNMYAVITSANDVIKAINNGMQIGNNGSETPMVKGMAYFMQSLGNGYVGLIFDKGYPSDETTDYTTLQMQDYHASINMAVSQLEKAIAIFEANDFTLPTEWMNGTYTNEDMAKIAHSFIARLLVYSPRNTTERDAVDWTKVLQHAQAGITTDFSIEGDGNITDRKWMSYYKYYMARPSWGKVDMRVLHMLDASIPSHWPEGGLGALPNNGFMNSTDHRAATDFEYNSSNNRPERGIYRWSTYRYSRFDSYISANFFAPIVLMRKAENDLFIAEAYARTNQLDPAKGIINAGTRVTRGQLPTITSNDPAVILNAIFYERTIELPLTGMGIEFFDMRRNGLLQTGSLLHLPIPGQQLEVLGLPIYSFGGIDPQYGVSNQDVAINGWYTP
jgi:hypothetical protein